MTFPTAATITAFVLVTLIAYIFVAIGTALIAGAVAAVIAFLLTGTKLL